jgi:hypothetical protein
MFIAMDAPASEARSPCRKAALMRHAASPTAPRSRGPAKHGKRRKTHAEIRGGSERVFSHSARAPTVGSTTFPTNPRHHKSDAPPGDARDTADLTTTLRKNNWRGHKSGAYSVRSPIDSNTRDARIERRFRSWGFRRSSASSVNRMRPA